MGGNINSVTGFRCLSYRDACILSGDAEYTTYRREITDGTQNAATGCILSSNLPDIYSTDGDKETWNSKYTAATCNNHHVRVSAALGGLFHYSIVPIYNGLTLILLNKKNTDSNNPYAKDTKLDNIIDSKFITNPNLLIESLKTYLNNNLVLLFDIIKLRINKKNRHNKYQAYLSSDNQLISFTDSDSSNYIQQPSIGSIISAEFFINLNEKLAPYFEVDKDCLSKNEQTYIYLSAYNDSIQHGKILSGNVISSDSANNSVLLNISKVIGECVCYSDCGGYSVCWCYGNCNHY